MRFTFRLLAAVAVLAGVVSSSKATTITFDSFSTPSPALVAPPGTLDLASGSPDGGLFSGWSRSSQYFSAVGSAGNFSSIGAGSFNTSANSSTAITTTLQYLFAGGFDLTGLDTITLLFESLNPGTGATGLDILVELEDADGGIASAILSPSGSGSPPPLILGLTGSIDLTRIVAFRIEFNKDATLGTDFILTQIDLDGRGGIFGDPEPVPEPASMVVFGVLALGGAFVARRKLAKKVAA
jgi:hypothetical protein